MFIHNFKYALKTLFKNKMLIFWTFLFPIILGVFFNMAFSNIENSEKLEIIDIAIVDEEEYRVDDFYKEIFETLSSGDKKLFNVNYVSLEEAKDKLLEKEISGYIIYLDNPKLVVANSGINETVIRNVLEEIEDTKDIINNLVQLKVQEEILKNPEVLNYMESLTARIYEEAVNELNNVQVNVKDISKSNLSYTMIEYYTLIAMTCLYGGLLGMTAINKCLPNMSSNGKRVSIAPTKKSTMIVSSVLASYIVQLIGLSLLFLFTIFVIKVDYGRNLGLVVLLACVGSLAGLLLGVMIASVIKAHENLKLGIIISVTMLGCFLSGMMGITMKYLVDTKMPIVNKLNPASMITDGFYALYYYETTERYFFNIFSLLLVAGILFFISYMFLRRQKYDNI